MGGLLSDSPHSLSQGGEASAEEREEASKAEILTGNGIEKAEVTKTHAQVRASGERHWDSCLAPPRES